MFFPGLSSQWKLLDGQLLHCCCSRYSIPCFRFPNTSPRMCNIDMTRFCGLPDQTDALENDDSASILIYVGYLGEWWGLKANEGFLNANLASQRQLPAVTGSVITIAQRQIRYSKLNLKYRDYKSRSKTQHKG
eukprot:773087-Amphidinium_carterae.1